MQITFFSGESPGNNKTSWLLCVWCVLSSAAVRGKQGEVLHAERGVREWLAIMDRYSESEEKTAWHDAQQHYPLLFDPRWRRVG